MIFLIFSLALAQAPSDASASIPAAMSTFHGRVVRAEDGAPIARARAVLHREPSVVSVESGGASSEVGAIAVTDADGRFELQYAPDQPSWILVEAEGRTRAACGRLDGHARSESALVFELPRAAQLEFEDAMRGHLSVWSGVEAHVEAPLYASSFPAWLGVTSAPPMLRYAPSAMGEPFVLHGLPAGVPLRVEFFREGQCIDALDEDVVLRAGETRKSSWKPRAPGSDRGGLLTVAAIDEFGAPIVDANVSIERAAEGQTTIADFELAVHQVTGADGTFRWANLRPGDYVLDLVGDLCARPVIVTLDGADTVSISILARPSRSIAGTVFDHTGAPIAGAEVAFTSWSDQFLWDVRARSVADGSFVLRGVPRDESGILRARHPDNPSVEIMQVEFDAEILRDGTTRKLEPPVRRRLRLPITAKLRVTVLDTNGAPTTARVRCDGRGELAARWPGVDSVDAIFDVPPGEHTMSAVTTDGRVAFAVTSVADGSPHEVTLRLEPAGSLRLRNRGPRQSLRATISTPAGNVFGATTLRAGVDTVVLIPAGDWRVHTPDTAMPDIDVRIESGLESTVEF